MRSSCYCRNRINHHSNSIGFMAVSARRLVSYQSQWQFHRSKRPAGPSSRSSPFDIHLDLYPDHHLPPAFRLGPLRSRSSSHQVQRDDVILNFFSFLMIDYQRFSCSVNWESKMDNNRSYILYMFAMGLFIPLMAIFVSYISIVLFIHKVIMTSDETSFEKNRKFLGKFNCQTKGIIMKVA